MALINKALAFLKLLESVNYTKTIRCFNCDETILQR